MIFVFVCFTSITVQIHLRIYHIYYEYSLYPQIYYLQFSTNNPIHIASFNNLIFKMRFVTCTVHVHTFDSLMNSPSEISDSYQFSTKFSWNHNASAVDIIIISIVYITRIVYFKRNSHKKYTSIMLNTNKNNTI